MTGIIVTVPPTVELPPGSTTGGSAVLPGVTYTYAILSLPQTWTAKQTFPLGNISIQAADIVGLASAVPGGSNTQLQYNNSGAFGGITGATTNGTALTLVAPVLGTPASGTLTNCTAFNLTTTGSSGAATYSAGTLNIPQYSGGGVSSLNGSTGALVSYFAPQGRITLASGVPVMGTSQSGCTTVYYTPYAGNMVPIYDGTNMVPTVVAEVSQATTDATKSPAAVAASKVYDLFVWNDSGTIRCTRGPAWTNATTRGYTFTMVNGILLNTSAVTNGPAASRGTWVGTIASNASSTIDWTLGSSGSGGVAAVLNVWNAYNRVEISTAVNDNGANYNYTTATIRQARASTGNQISYVVGAAEDSAFAQYWGFANAVAVGATPQTGIGLDSITAFTNYQFTAAYAVVSLSQNTTSVWNPAIGTHYLAGLEKGDGTNANTFGLSGLMTLSFKFRM